MQHLWKCRAVNSKFYFKELRKVFFLQFIKKTENVQKMMMKSNESHAKVVGEL